MYLDPIDDDAISTSTIGSVARDLPLRLKDLNPEDSRVKTHAIGPRTIEATDLPCDSGNLPEITIPPSGSNNINKIAHTAGISDLAISDIPEEFSPELSWEKIETGIRKDPNIALEAVKAGLAREKLGSDKLRRHSQEIKQHLKNIDSLLDLSAELTALGEKDSHVISEKIEGMISQLRDNGIELWASGEKKITKDKLGEMKSLISSQIDKSRTALQTTITVEIQPEMNNLNSIMNIIQQMIQADNRFKKHANDNSTK